MTKLPIGFKEKEGTKLREYQKTSVAFGINQGSSGQLHEMGLGKTVIAISIARYHIQFSNVKKVLVVCPPSLLLNWQAQIKKFSEYKSVILPSTRQGRLHTALTNRAEFHIVNYESLYPLARDAGIDIEESHEKGRVILGKSIYKDNVKTSSALLSKYDMIILDESGKHLRHITSLVSKTCMLLSQYAKYRIILTGTLISKNPLNLWVQFYCLDLGKTFGNNFYWFRNTFFYKITKGDFIKYQIQPKYVPVFNKAINAKCIRFTKTEVLPELPPMIDYKIEISFSDTLMKQYNSLKKNVISEIETEMGKKHFNITNILTRMIRLQQFTSGFASEGKGKEKVLKETPKLDALVEEVETIVENNESVVIGCRFTFSIDMIAKRLKKYNPLILDGRVKKKQEKYKIWRTFQTSKTHNVLIVQSDSGGFGIELFKENSTDKYQHTIIYENTWLPDTREQLKSRTHRSGQNATCRIVDITVKDTIDERILSTLKAEKEIADAIQKTGYKKFLG